VNRPLGALAVTVALAAATLVGVWAGAAAPPRATPESVGLSSSRLRQATELLQRHVVDRTIAGAVAVARNGKLAYLEPVGFRDLGTRAPMSPQSIFRIYSMTKSVTAVAAMMLHEEGRFGLGDPVSRYLPEFERVAVFETPDGPTRPAARTITVRRSSKAPSASVHGAGLSAFRPDAVEPRGARRVRLLEPETLDRIVANGLSDEIAKARGGMGWGRANVNVAADGEYRWDGTAGTIFWVDPAHRMVTILMTQIAPANPDSLRQKCKALVHQSLVD
jgi:CubicO group peptidase (beta-lactamase class C family)